MRMYLYFFHIGFNKHNKILLFSWMALQTDCGLSLRQAVFHLWRDKLWHSESLVSALCDSLSGEKRSCDWLKRGVASLRHRLCSLHIHCSFFLSDRFGVKRLQMITCSERQFMYCMLNHLHIFLKRLTKKLLCHSIVENFISGLNHIVASSNIFQCKTWQK